MSPASQSYTPRFFKALGWFVSLLVPVVMILLAVRVMMTPAYLNFEYNTPGFPPDPYGFTKQERLYWSRLAVNYLVNDAGIAYLADLRFPEGQRAPDQSCQLMEDCTRLYNQRELQHMVDVKNVVRGAMNVLLIALVGLVALGLWAWRGGWWDIYRHALGRGGGLTVWLLAGIILFVLIAFGLIFVAFHQVFFESGTWVFFYSDTLIRLFPERFWRDTFLAVGILAGGAGLLLRYSMRRLLASS